MPFHWGRFRGIALNNGKPVLAEIMGDNIYFDTCVYHQPGIDLLTKVMPIDNILFASEMVGAVKGMDPKTGLLSTIPSAISRKPSREPTGTRFTRAMRARCIAGSRPRPPQRRRRHEAPRALAKARKKTTTDGSRARTS